MALDVHGALETIKTRVLPAARPAAYKALVGRLEQAKAQATRIELKHRYSVLVHYVKAKAREDHDWS